MAKQGSFGAYSSVPTTTGMGQGSAQVFTPQAGRLDTTAIQRGAQAIGQGISDAAAEKKAAEAKAAKAKAEADAKLNERKAGQYNYNEAAMNMATDEIQKKYINGEIDFAEYNEQINRFTKNTEGIRQFETGVLQPEQQKFATDENARSYGEDGGWDTYANRTDYLSGDLDETAIELIKEDPTLGKFNAYQQSKYRDVQKNFSKYDPEFSLAGAAFSDSAWSSFKDSQDETTRAIIEDAEKQGYDKKTIVSTKIGSDKYRDHLKQRPDIMGKWVQQQKFNENLSPEYIQNLFSEDMSSLVTEAYSDEIDKLILPSGGKETTVDFVKAPTDGSREEEIVNRAIDFKNAYALAQNTDDLPKANEQLNRFIRDVDASVEVIVDDEGKRQLKIFKGTTGSGENIEPKLVKIIPLNNVEGGYRAFTDLGLITEKALKESKVTQDFEFKKAPIMKARKLTEKLVKAEDEWGVDNSLEDVRKEIEGLAGVSVRINKSSDKGTLTIGEGKDAFSLSLPTSADSKEVQEQKYKILEDFLSQLDTEKTDISNSSNQQAPKKEGNSSGGSMSKF